VEPQAYDDIIQHLVRIAAHQDTINERVAASLESLATTQACIETLLARMLRQGENGQEA
jgi:hypothetical protein